MSMKLCKGNILYNLKSNVKHSKNNLISVVNNIVKIIEK